ncbi:MAG: ribulose-phosphate 3-epimerase [Anaerolineales bacterium]|nr:ribulose-phosphate 3-epimerase [Anaerolineales bacterium]MCS7249220.1 ribulose-phosphate 3-epimerase [Anaerolineales bacterium]MDW8163033.1 ribulose-phosphate 3-epimerase [Anaerolineales bacterium]MDW8448206.1 ribulose-phosphate 3-epimerase [Anaerolineales bacterium]
MKVRIAPSILSANFARLGEEVREAVAAGVEIIHIDVMDGHFVPNITVGPLVVEALKPLAREMGFVLDVHLMIEHPERYIESFAQAGADWLTVHVEACPHLHRVIQQIRSSGVKAGVTLNPATPLSMLDEILSEVDLVLVMSVNPGFGGQSYIPSSTAKIARLKRTLEERALSHVEIEVDGGIAPATAGEVAKAGATILVAGSAVFNSKASISDNIKALEFAILQGTA